MPGAHYGVFDVWGDVLPDEKDIDAVCGICLPRGRPDLLELPLEEALLGSPSSSSSGEEEAAPAEPSGSDVPLGPSGPPVSLVPS